MINTLENDKPLSVIISDTTTFAHTNLFEFEIISTQNNVQNIYRKYELNENYRSSDYKMW